MEILFDAGKDAEATVQKIHDKYVKQVDELYAATTQIGRAACRERV